MSSPYVGECRLVAFNFAPAGWAYCQGQLVAIAENDVLFQLLGTTYGGDGQETFALPDLRGRVPIHQGPGFPLAQVGGVETVTLSTQQIPAHTHTLMGSGNNGNTNLLSNSVLAVTATPVYDGGSPNANTPMNAQAIQPVGGSQPHENLQPYLALNWIISLYGIFPSQT
ncbi:MAG TPA: tail fiber protein [Bryobacteraceae bacterium]|nr:tail fiber protein [Bryobacteraceae bacterium]